MEDFDLAEEHFEKLKTSPQGGRISGSKAGLDAAWNRTGTL